MFLKIVSPAAPDCFAVPMCHVCVCAYLVVLAMSVDHPVLSISADLQLEGGNVVRFLGFF